MAYASNIHVAVYQVLDQVMGADMPPPGARALVHSIIDDLHAAAAPSPMIKHAERISLQLHFLECAAARSDKHLAAEAHENLKILAAAWLNERIATH